MNLHKYAGFLQLSSTQAKVNRQQRRMFDLLMAITKKDLMGLSGGLSSLDFLPTKSRASCQLHF